MKFAPARFLPYRHEGSALFPNQIHVMVIVWTNLNLETWLFRRRGCSHETYYYPLQVGCFVYLELRDDCPDNSRWDLVALLSSLKHCRFLSDTFRFRRRLPPLRLSDSLNQLIGLFWHAHRVLSILLLVILSQPLIATWWQLFGISLMNRISHEIHSILG